MTPDLNYSITTRNQIMTMWWRIPEYKTARVAFVQRNPVCIRCGRPTKTPGHSHEDYRDFKTYLNAVKSDKCDPLCNICNLNERAGRKPCPECVALNKKYGIRIRYIPQSEEVCFDHLPAEEHHRIWVSQRRKEIMKNRHPCGWHGTEQRCLAPIRYSGVCDRSPKNCTGCDHYMQKLVTV